MLSDITLANALYWASGACAGAILGLAAARPIARRMVRREQDQLRTAIANVAADIMGAVNDQRRAKQ